MPACGATSFGNRVRLDFIFGSQCFSEVGLGQSCSSPPVYTDDLMKGTDLKTIFVFGFFEEDGNLDPSLRPQTTSRESFRHFRKVF